MELLLDTTNIYSIRAQRLNHGYFSYVHIYAYVKKVEHL